MNQRPREVTWDAPLLALSLLRSLYTNTKNVICILSNNAENIYLILMSNVLTLRAPKNVAMAPTISREAEEAIRLRLEDDYWDWN